MSGLGEIGKPLFVEAFVSELTIETLHVGILDGFPGFDETLLHPGALRPLEQGSAGQLRAVVMNEFFWITVDGGQFIEIASEALARDGVSMNWPLRLKLRPQISLQQNMK